MPIQDITQAVGAWSLNLTDDVPPEVWDSLGYWGHIAVVRGRLAPPDITDALLTPGVAAYVAPVRERDRGDSYRIAGPGMAAWLGDEDGKGAVYETPVELTDATVPDAARALLPASGAVTEGTFYAVPDRTYTGRHVYTDPRTAITYLCQTVSTDVHPVSWRVNSDATLDVGLDEDLFVTDPKCIIVRRGAGEDLAIRARAGAMEVASDLEDFTTRVVLLAEGEGDSIATGSADINPALDPYLDLHGNPVAMTRLVSESSTDTGNADTRAQLQLNRFSGTRNALTLTAADYDVQGDYTVGDYVYVYDPDSGLVDTSLEIVFRGMRINPIKLKVTEVCWPVTTGHTVAYRAGDGTWTNLTDYVAWESGGGVKVTVGDFQRALNSAGTEPVGSRPNQDTSIPGVPVLIEPFQGAAYLDSKGFTRARVVIQWSAPNNIDGSTVRDGDHYEIRYAVDTDSIYPATWSAVSEIRWADMQTWAQPFAAPDGEWQIAYVNWSDTTVQLQDLSPGVGYDVQIRAVDTSGNLGAWSGTTTFVATEDNIPPSTPEAPSVAASRIAVQITHTLGKASGGTFNLESDLDHLEIHAQYEPTFPPSDATLIGKLKANAGMIAAQIPAVATYQVESTDALYFKAVAVDIAGNRSGPSDPVQATALLIDDAHISDLTVSKVTAGTITASWVMAGEIKTADSGSRVRLSIDGIEVYSNAGIRTFFADADTGDVSIVGQISSSSAGRRVIVNPSGNPEIRFYADSGSDYSFISAFSQSSLTGIGINGAPYVNGSDTLGNRIVVYPNSGGVQIQNIISSTQVQKGSFVSINPNTFVARYEDDVAGVLGGNFYTDASSARVSYNPGGSNESGFHSVANSIFTYGSMASQQGATQTFVVKSLSLSGGAGTYGTSFDVTYPSRPYGMMGFGMGATGGQGRFTSISASAWSGTRDVGGTAFADCLFVRAL